MGRLFWKFFLIVWLAQLAAALGTSLYFWMDRQAIEARFASRLQAEGWQAPPPRPFPPFAPPGPPPEAGARPPPPPPFAGPAGEPPPDIPPPALMHILAGIVASLLSAAAIAWMVSRPVARLKAAFVAAGSGDLSVRIGPTLGRRRDELAELGREFDRMTTRLAGVLDTQQRLLHDVSHEMRSPLARMHAAIGLARQQPARTPETLERLEREGERMDRLVGELLTLSRIDAGTGGTAEIVDLSELLAELVEDARFEADQHGIAVTLDTPPELLTRAAPELLLRAVENVVRNALRHSPVGGTVAIRVTADATRCRMLIDDDGPGVPEQELENIFAPFRRLDGKPGGYGLGLTIARRALHAVDGRISAKNRPTGGLRVTIELPRISA